MRDVQVLHRRLSDDVAGLGLADDPGARGLIGRLRDEADHKYRELLIVLRSDRYLDLIEQLREQLAQPKLRPDAPHRGARKLVRTPWAKLRRAVETLPSSPADTELHAVRIRAKRCRYAAEAAGKQAGHRASQLAAACTDLQDALGEHQDAVVAQRWLSGIVPQLTPGEAFVAGQLRAVQQHEAAIARAAWPEAWHEVNKKRFRRWLA